MHISWANKANQEETIVLKGIDFHHSPEREQGPNHSEGDIPIDTDLAQEEEQQQMSKVEIMKVKEKEVHQTIDAGDVNVESVKLKIKNSREISHSPYLF